MSAAMVSRAASAFPTRAVAASRLASALFCQRRRSTALALVEPPASPASGTISAPSDTPGKKPKQGPPSGTASKKKPEQKSPETASKKPKQGPTPEKASKKPEQGSPSETASKKPKQGSPSEKESKKSEQGSTSEKESMKPKRGPPPTFMFPLLHQKVLDAVSGEVPSVWFSKKDTNKGSNKKYNTHVLGKFACSRGCSKRSWTSGKVAISIRRYPENGYNAVVFNQRCMSCKKLGILTLDEDSYVDRVAYRVKKWAGVEMEPKYYPQKETLPHRSDLCEGCRRGECSEGEE